MTMKERLTAQVREKLRAAVDGERKDEIVEELSGNLYAKYEDLVKTGVDPEEAYGEAMEGLGDVSELIELAGGTKVKAGLDAAADAITDLGRSAIHGAKDIWAGAKEPLKDMGRTIADAVKNLEITVTVENQHQFNYSVSAEDITGLELRLRSGDAVIHAWDEDAIQVIERSGRALDENKHASFFRREDGVLCVEQGGTAVGLASFCFGLFQSDFEIFLPRRVWDSLAVHSTNGDVSVTDPIQAGSVLVASTNGDVDLGTGMGCDSLNITTVNGDVEARELTCRAVIFKGTTGDMDVSLAAMPETMEVCTVSGDVTVALPENDGFAVGYKQVSGDLDSEFEMTTSLSRKEGLATYKGAQSPLYKMSTVSGDIQIDRA